MKEASLPVSGRKADLIDRLQTQFASSASTSTEAALEEAQTRALRPKMHPPQSETDVQVVQKEVAETVRILESLKLGGKSVGGMKGASIEGSLSSIRDSGVSATDEIAKARANGQPSLNEPQRGSSRHGARGGRAVPARAVAGEEAAKEELESVKSMLRNTVDDEDEGEEGGDATTREECVRSLRQRPANDLKVELIALRMHAKGRKPDLVQRLAVH